MQDGGDVMWEFIVSGWLPGTAIQITYEHCLLAGGVVFTLVMLSWVIQRRRVVRALLSMQQSQTDAVSQQ